MFDRLAADAVLLVHLGFIVFAVAGGLLAFRWRWVAFVHVPAALWAIVVESTGRLCPLTAIENHFRVSAGTSGYADSFVEHYLLHVIYPAGLTSGVQVALAMFVLVVNGAVYGRLLRGRRAAPRHA
jgi:hypothetical protein